MSDVTHDLPEKSPGLIAVLDAVRQTGRTAHPEAGARVSTLVFAVAVTEGLNPVELQAEVGAWSRILNGQLTGPDDELCPHGFPHEFCGNCHEEGI